VGRCQRTHRRSLIAYTEKLVNRLVFENLKHRPVRTLLSAIAIGVQVTLMLTLVGVSHGMIHDFAAHSRGTGADILIRPPGSSILGFSGGAMPEGIVRVVRGQPHVTIATGSLVQQTNRVLTSIAGINLAEFDAISGGFKYLEGGPFKGPDELIVDDVEAHGSHLHVGSLVDFGIKWRVCGVVESGKFSRMFTDLKSLQEKYSSTGKISVIWVKVDQEANVQDVIAVLKEKLPDYPIWSVEEYTSLISANNIPILQQFTGVVIGIGVVIGFLVVFLSMYTAVLERTREIGILKALGASPAYVMGILLRETVLLAIAGVIAGILMTYGSRTLLATFAPSFITEIVYYWWPIAAAIALAGALVGAIYPGLKAARQDAIEALSYD
jgi:putative ABC transport system permease protein